MSQTVTHIHYHRHRHWSSPIFERFDIGLKSQLRFHQTMATLWLVAMLIVPFFPGFWSHSVGILIVLEVSLYANFATECGAIPSTRAAINTDTVNISNSEVEIHR